MSQSQGSLYASQSRRASIKSTKYKPRSKILTDKIQNKRIARLQRQVSTLTKAEMGLQTYGQTLQTMTTTPQISHLFACPARGDGDYEREGNVIVLKRLTVSVVINGSYLDTGILVDRYNVCGYKIGFVKSPLGAAFTNLTAARCWDTAHANVLTGPMADFVHDYATSVQQLSHDYCVVTGSSMSPAIGVNTDCTKDTVWIKKHIFTFPRGIKMECVVPDAAGAAGWITNLPYITWMSDSGSAVHPTISWSSCAEYEM